VTFFFPQDGANEEVFAKLLISALPLPFRELALAILFLSVLLR
jgi:hypothetical protein